MYTNDDLKRLAIEYRNEAHKAFEGNKLKEAITLMQKSLELFRSLGEAEGLVETLNSMGVIYSIFASDDMAIDFYLEALQIAVNNQLYFYMAKLYNNIGSKYQEYDENTTAMEYFRKAESLLGCDECISSKQFQVLHTVVYLNLALSSIKTGQVENAFNYITKSKLYLAELKDLSYEFAERAVECMIMYEMDELDFVDLNIDSVMIGIAAHEHSNDVLQTISVLCELLAKMKDYDRWEKCLEILMQIANALEDNQFYMSTYQLWADYYKTIDNTDEYQKVCSMHMKYYVKQTVNNKRRRAEAIRLKIEINEIEAQRVEAIKKSHTDPLTGTGNRTKLESDFESILAECCKRGERLGLGIIDIDCFKQVNDTYGHLYGDDCLKLIAQCITKVLGEAGLAYRYGGDEFVVLVANCAEGTLDEIGTQIRDAVERENIQNIRSTVQPIVTLSQGYAYMFPDENSEVDSIIKYADKALYSVKENGKDDYNVIMVGKKDYHYFYEAYSANLEKEALLEESYKQAESKEDWVMNLQQRAHAMHELYEANETLIAKYIRPLLEGFDTLDDEIAVEIFKEIWKLHQDNKTDYLVMIEIGQLLEEYFSERDFPEEHICILTILAKAYNELDHEKFFSKAMKYFEKLDIYRNYFNCIEDTTVCRVLCDAYFNGGVFIAENEATTLREALDIINRNIYFFDNSNVADKLGFSKEEALDYKDRFKSMVLAGKLIRMIDVIPDNSDYQEAFDILVELYDRHVALLNNELLLDERLFGSYYMNKYLLGHISRRELYNRHKAYTEYTLKDDGSAAYCDAGVYRSHRFNTMMYFVPVMFSIVNEFESEDKKELEVDFLDSMVDMYVEYITTIPEASQEVFVRRALCSSLRMMLANVSDRVDAYELLYKVIVRRNVDITIHSLMVAGISKLIVEAIYRNNPMLMKGCLGMTEEAEILEKWPEVKRFAENAGMLHDIGKIDIAHITHKQTRNLTDIEFANIYLHPEYGTMIIDNSYELKEYIPIVLGHHRSFDDKKGYPVDYRYKENGELLLVDVIRIADALDAATDGIGRNYTKAKSFKEAMYEMVEGKGTDYNPELVDMMITDTIFQSAVEQFLTQGRVEICYDVYHEYSK